MIKEFVIITEQAANVLAWQRNSFQPGPTTKKNNISAMTSRMMNGLTTSRELRAFHENDKYSSGYEQSDVLCPEPVVSPLPRLSVLQQEILRTLAYFDVFSYPLSTEQVYTFLPLNSVSIAQVGETLDSLVNCGIVERSHSFYFLADRTASVVSERLQNEIRATRMMKRVKKIAFFLRQVPFVRAVFITGSLSKNVAGPSSDADFMIVTAPRRLWITKIFLTAIRRVFLLNSIRYFCLNLFVTEKGFQFPNRNVFNAIEIATTRVLWNRASYQKFQSANSWIEQFLPNRKRDVPAAHEESNTRSPVQKIIEAMVSIFPLDLLDRRIMESAHRYWRKKNLHLDDERFNALFHCTPDISTVWYDDHQTRILNGYRRRLAKFGIERAA